MRQETDFLGSVSIPSDVYYGISTKRALDNFNVSNELVNIKIVRELVNLKKQAAFTNHKLGYIDDKIGNAIMDACDAVLSGKFDSNFVVNLKRFILAPILTGSKKLLKLIWGSYLVVLQL